MSADLNANSEKSCCDPELVFELVDGALGSKRRGEVFAHLESCPGCREYYEREKSLSESLCSDESVGFTLAPSVCREVAMALPTRSGKARLMWGVLAAGIFVCAGFALSVGGNSPLVMASGPLEVFWGVGSGLADATAMALSFAAPVIVIALLVGAVIDLLVFGVVLSVLRRQSNRQTRRA